MEPREKWSYVGNEPGYNQARTDAEYPQRFFSEYCFCPVVAIESLPNFFLLRAEALGGHRRAAP